MIEKLSEIDLNTIAIVDDNMQNAEALSVNVETCGSKAITFVEDFSDLDALIKKVMEKSNGVLCDHRLGYGTPATFSGAKAVASWYDHQFPAILVSEYTDLDMYTTIRKYRRKIPVAIPRDTISKKNLIEGFIICLNEIKNHLPPYRKPRRALVRIVGTSVDSNIDIVEAFIPQWNLHKAVRFPLSLFGNVKKDDIKPNMLFIADINIGARDTQELFFENFELAPEPDPNDGLA